MDGIEVEQSSYVYGTLAEPYGACLPLPSRAEVERVLGGPAFSSRGAFSSCSSSSPQLHMFWKPHAGENDKMKCC